MTQTRKAASYANCTANGKVCIITLYDNVNYGNKLQNYAVKCLVERRGYSANTLVLRKDPFRESVKLFIRKIKALRGDVKAERYVNLSAFSREYLGIDYYYTSKGQIEEDINNDYDLFVTGSDQVWNPEVRTTDLENFLLTFTSDDKKVSIAPSLGTTYVPDEMKTRFSDGLLGFRKLSCREESGCEVIEELTGKRVVRLCDPTLALTADFWREFSELKSPRRLKGKSVQLTDKPYIVMFFLGECDPTVRSRIFEYAEEKGYEIKEPSFRGDADYAMLPQEFVAMIDNAQMVFTDSFHASAFSMNLETPFWVFDRLRDRTDELNTHMGSRIASLTELYELTDRYITDVSVLEGRDALVFDEPIDYSGARAQLEIERERMDDYLNESLARGSGIKNVRNLMDED